MAKLLPLAFAALFALSWLGERGPEESVQVVDGDTLKLAGERIRLFGIDAPEAAQTCADGGGQRYACGDRAREALIALIGGQPVACRGSERDRYGRRIAVCEAGGTDLNRAMVATGWALAFRRYSSVYLAAEGAAAHDRRGIWAGTFEAPWDWRDNPTAEQRASACRIKGNISETGRIYHVPGSRDYARTRISEAKGERWFCSAAEAEQAGWRAPRG